MKSELGKEIAHYMDLSYTVIMRRDDEGDFVARVAELPGCSAHGPSPAEASENLREAQQLWIEDCLDAGQRVPEPEPDEALPSGKWVQRVPRTLHQKLARLAKREHVSLNQLVASMLSEAAVTRGRRLGLEKNTGWRALTRTSLKPKAASP